MIKVSKTFTFILAGSAILVAVYVVPIAYADYAPRVELSSIFNYKNQFLTGIASDCLDNNTFKNIDSYKQSIKQVTKPPKLKKYELIKASDMTFSLSLSVKDIYWGAPWKFWVVAIPDGSNIVFELKCSEKGIEQKVISTTIPVIHLPAHVRDQIWNDNQALKLITAQDAAPA